MSKKGIGQRAFQGVILLFGRRIWNQLISIGVLAILARKLDPIDFGILSLSDVLLKFTTVLAAAGFGAYIMYYKSKGEQDEKEEFNAIFWLSLLITLCTVGIAFAFIPGYVIPWIPEMAGNEKAINVFYIMICIFFFEQMASLPVNIMRKQLRYKRYVGLQIGFTTLESFGKVAGVFLGLGIYTLVIPALIISPIRCIVFFLLSGFHPFARLNHSRWKNIFNYSKFVMGTDFLRLLINRGDIFIVGKFIGLEAVGIYNIASQLANLISRNIIFAVNDVSFPALSHIKSDMQKLISKYFLLVELVSFSTVPLYIFMIAESESIFNILYGSKWLQGIIIFQVLTIVQMYRPVSSFAGMVLNLTRKQNYVFYQLIIFLPIYLAAAYFGSYYGLIGVTVFMTVTKMVRRHVLIDLLARTMKVRIYRFYLVSWEFFVASAIAVAPLLALVYWFPKDSTLSYFIELSIGAVIFFSVYIGVIRWLFQSKAQVIYEFIDSVSLKLGRVYKLVFIR